MNSPVGRRLYLRIWLAVVLAVAVVTLLVGWIWQIQVEHERAQRPGREIILRNEAGEVIGKASGRAVRVPGQGWEFQVPMVDGQVMTVQLPRPPRPPGKVEPFWLERPFGFFWLLVLVAVAVALGAYPIVRRLTQRLEAVQRGVERWGQGELSYRLPVQGHDEVAFLAQRFNVAAERVQTLVRSHQAFLANASHELRSPLARIRMGLELMPSVADTLPARGHRAELARNIAELDQLIDEILLASRLDLADEPLGQMEEVDLVGLAAEVCAQANVALSLQEGDQPPMVWGSARLLRRLLNNLLENARRYGKNGTGMAEVQVDIGVRAGQKGAPPVAELVVSDRGPGVPAEQRARIFEPFYRLPGASERDGGVGLGLALVKTIAERHGGQIRCQNRPGGGAQFVVTLPLHRPPHTSK